MSIRYLKEKTVLPKIGRMFTKRWKSENVENEWKYRIDLRNMPTKPEDLKVTMDRKTNIIFVSGTSEVERKFENGNIKSNHIWPRVVQ